VSDTPHPGCNVTRNGLRLDSFTSASLCRQRIGRLSIMLAALQVLGGTAEGSVESQRWRLVLRPPSPQVHAEHARKRSELSASFWSARDSVLERIWNYRIDDKPFDPKDPFHYLGCQLHFTTRQNTADPASLELISLNDNAGSHLYWIRLRQVEWVDRTNDLVQVDLDWTRRPTDRRLMRIWPMNSMVDPFEVNLADTSWGAKFDSLITERDSLEATIAVNLIALDRPFWLPRSKRWTTGPDEVARLAVAASFYWIRELANWRRFPASPGEVDHQRAWSYAEAVIRGERGYEGGP